jgi:RNA polymerase sigma-70 factor (ECF subfamily)
MTRTALAEAELEALCRQHLDMVYRYCWLCLGENEADDAASEVFIVAWEKGGRVPPEARRAWLLGVARGLVANRLRAGRNRAALANRYFLESDHHVPDPAEAVVGVDQLRSALMSLRRSDREVLALAAMGGFSQVEMGQALGCSAKAAGIRLSRARAKLSQVLGLDQAQGLQPVTLVPSAVPMQMGVSQ